MGQINHIQLHAIITKLGITDKFNDNERNYDSYGSYDSDDSYDSYGS